MEITNRYDALGIPLPDPKTMCKGQCEGTGMIPVYAAVTASGVYPCIEEDPVLVALWEKAHEEAGIHDCDGWHFVTCPECGGSGKKEE